MKIKKGILLCCLAFLCFANTAMANDELIIMGNSQSLKFAEHWFSFFEDKGVPYTVKEIKDFESYKNEKNIFIMTTLNDKTLDKVFAKAPERLEESRSMKSSLYDRLPDVFADGQYIFVFTGATESSALKISKEMREEWWPILADNFDIPLLEEEIFAY